MFKKSHEVSISGRVAIACTCLFFQHTVLGMGGLLGPVPAVDIQGTQGVGAGPQWAPCGWESWLGN